MTIETATDETAFSFEADPNTLVVCPGCDLIHNKMEICDGEAGACQRCEMEFVFPSAHRFDHTIALAITSLFLMVGSISFPFLSMSRAGLKNEANLLQVALTFHEGWFILVGLLFVTFVIVFPTYRALSLIYSLWPLSRGNRPFRFARHAFALSETLTPWGMAEIFFIGTGVALVKVTKLANVEFEFSFWIFGLLILNLVLMNLTLHRKDVWQQLNRNAA